MSTIAYEVSEPQEETVSAFLMVVLEYAQQIGLFALLAGLVRVPMKQGRYSLLHKAQTVMASIVLQAFANAAASNRRRPGAYSNVTTSGL